MARQSRTRMDEMVKCLLLSCDSAQALLEHDRIKPPCADEIFVFKIKFLSSLLLDELLAEVEGAPRRRVFVNTAPSRTWDSLTISNDSWLHMALFDPRVSARIGSLFGVTPTCFGRGMAWAHAYKAGEFISRHVDASGDWQMVICLKGKRASGGNLVIETHERDISIPLVVGEGVIFPATRYYHWTDPVLPGDGNGDAERVTLVARYYLRA